MIYWELEELRDLLHKPPKERTLLESLRLIELNEKLWRSQYALGIRQPYETTTDSNTSNEKT